MTYRGHVEKGVVVLDEPAELRDGDKVAVRPLRGRRKPEAEGRRSPTLHERLKDVIGSIEGLPSDFARNHDHYIHGVPKEGCVLRTPHMKCQKQGGSPRRSGERQPTLYDELKPIVGKAKGLTVDAARNHDHYLYGLPRK